MAAAALHKDFDVGKLATWAPGKPVPFAFLATMFEEISGESSRHAKQRLIINAFRAILATTPGDLLPAVYLCVNQARAWARVTRVEEVPVPSWPARRATCCRPCTCVSTRRRPGLGF